MSSAPSSRYSKTARLDLRKLMSKYPEVEESFAPFPSPLQHNRAQTYLKQLPQQIRFELEFVDFAEAHG